ncbi:hypothetical protein TNCV_1110701 [Trichonephila clavipes]|nr:hypothetical protein TNCV_1110701 [Trichonephila clavipes]
MVPQKSYQAPREKNNKRAGLVKKIKTRRLQNQGKKEKGKEEREWAVIKCPQNREGGGVIIRMVLLCVSGSN